MTEQLTLEELAGPIGIDEFNAAREITKPELEEFIRGIRGISDDELFEAARRWIYESANMNRFSGRFNFEDVHCRATVCYYEAKRRHVEAGHSDDCVGDTIYGRAFIRVTKDELGHALRDPSPCSCGREDRSRRDS